MAKKKAGSRFFMDEAEKILRVAVEGNENLVVWRGRFPHKTGWGEYKRVFEQETILAGMPDENNPSGPPGIPIVSIHVDDSAYVQFRAGSPNDFSASIPFGGGHNPIDDVKEAAKKLSNLGL